MIKNTLIIAVALACCGSTGNAQLTIGSGGLYIQSGATLVLDRLHLQPNEGIHIQNNALSITNVPVSGTPKASITRVYQWTDTIHTKGLIGIYVQPSELNGNNFNALQLAYNPTSDPANYTVSNVSVANSSNNFVFETTASTTWMQLTSVENNTVLPLHLLSFTGAQKGKSSWLQWKVAHEENARDYTIERSTNGKNFVKIGCQDAVCNGCTSEVDYQFEDRQPASGNNYYRLLMRDWDGKYTYSNIVQLYYAPSMPAITVSPNPATNKITLSGLNPSEIYNLQITAADGKIVLAKTLMQTGASYAINISAWADGAYLLRLDSREGKIYHQTVIKQ